MRRLLILTMLACLSGCQSASQPSRAETETIGTSQTVSGLEAKVDRLQATLDSIIQERIDKSRSFKEYEVCVKTCQDRFFWTEDGLDTHGAARKQCLDRCTVPEGYNEC